MTINHNENNHMNTIDLKPASAYSLYRLYIFEKQIKALFKIYTYI